MFVTQFPDIQWLRAKAKSNFSDQKGLKGVTLLDKGWPNIVLSTKSFGAERTGIKGPYSFFYNVAGTSIIKAGGKELKVEQNNYVTTNHGEYYDLIIPDGQPTTTYNIHFGERLYQDVLGSVRRPQAISLDNPLDLCTDVIHRINLRATNCEVRAAFTLLHNYYEKEKVVRDEEEELLTNLLVALIKIEKREIEGINHISSEKASTRKELMRRLILSMEYMLEAYNQKISLDHLSEISQLSKFHHNRTFKEAFGISPLQFLKMVRIEKAIHLLKHKNYSIREIALQSGYEEPNAFMRAFKQVTGLPPAKYRVLNN